MTINLLALAIKRLIEKKVIQKYFYSNFTLNKLFKTSWYMEFYGGLWIAERTKEDTEEYVTKRVGVDKYKNIYTNRIYLADMKNRLSVQFIHFCDIPEKDSIIIHEGVIYRCYEKTYEHGYGRIPGYIRLNAIPEGRSTLK